MSDDVMRASVFLLDDHPLIRDSLTSLVNQQPDLVISGEAESAEQALYEIGAGKPDIAIVDISLRETSGLDLLKAVKEASPQTQVVVLSMHDERLYAERCIRAGARAYVMKGESSKRILTAIRAVLLGRLWLSEQMSASLAEKFVGRREISSNSPLEHLSDRELEVFNFLGRGKETRQIAQSLGVSIKTVQAYCGRIKQKLRLSTASELIREAIRWHEGQEVL